MSDPNATQPLYDGTVPARSEKLRPSDAGDAAALYSKLYHDEKRKRESLERELTEARIYNREAFDRIKALEAAQSATATLELLQEVAASGVAYDAGKYVEVQIDQDTWQQLRSIASRAKD